jgi:hypothetical protein
MGNYGGDVCYRGLSERHDRSRPAADHRNHAWRPARPGLLAAGSPCASHNLDDGCTCHGRLRHGAAQSIRHCVRSLCFHAPRDPGSYRRAFTSTAFCSRLGNSDWRRIRASCGALPFPAEASRAVKLSLLATAGSREKWEEAELTRRVGSATSGCRRRGRGSGAASGLMPPSRRRNRAACPSLLRRDGRASRVASW